MKVGIGSYLGDLTFTFKQEQKTKIYIITTKQIYDLCNTVIPSAICKHAICISKNDLMYSQH